MLDCSKKSLTIQGCLRCLKSVKTYLRNYLQENRRKSRVWILCKYMFIIGIQKCKCVLKLFHLSSEN